MIGAGSSSDAGEGTLVIEGGDSDREVGDSSGKRSRRGSIEGIRDNCGFHRKKKKKKKKVIR